MHRVMVALLVAFVGALVGYVTPSWGSQPIEGRDFTVVNPVQPTAQDKVEVVEFFSYKCPHCASFAPTLDAWAKKLPNDVSFTRESVAIGIAPWVTAARTFYALQALGKVAALDAAVFKAIHEQGERFEDQAKITAWMAQHGVPAGDFRNAYDSFGVETKLKRGDTLSRTFRIPSIPTMIIDGKYMVAIASNVDFRQQLANVDALIARARADKKLPSTAK